MLQLIGQILLIAYVPGALIFRVPAGGREHRAALAAEERAFWAVAISVGWSLAVVLALAGIGRYSFERLLAVNAALSLALALAFRSRLAFGRAAPHPGWSALPPIGIAALGLWLYFPPTEYVIGGRDPGTYLNEGVQIAQRGGIVIEDPVIASVPAPFRDLFFPSHQSPWYYGIRFMGFFVQDPDSGRVIGQFPHLFPASIAIGYGLNGLTGARQTVGAWAILGLLAVYFVGARLFGTTAAAAASVLLSIHVVEIWFARYPNTELVMQALLFAALLAFARALEGSQRFFGAVSAALLALMLFLRYDVVLAFASVTAAAVLAPVTRQRVGPTFAVVLAAGATLGYWYLQGVMRAYSYYPLGFTRDQVGWWVLGGGLAAALVLQRQLRGQPSLAALVERTLPPAFAAALVVLALYAGFFRTGGGRLAAHDADSLRVFAWYTGPWVLAAIVAGVAVTAMQRFWRHPAFFLTLAAFSAFFFYKSRIVPEHFWAMRRYLAMTIPGGMLCLAALARTIAAQVTARLPAAGLRQNGGPLTVLSAAITLALLAPVGLHFWRMSAPVRSHVEYAGLIPRIEALAGQIPEDSLLVVESRNASDVHVLATSLAYIYARNVLVLNTPAPPRETFEAFLYWAERRYGSVLFLGGGGSDLLTRRISAQPIDSARFQVPEYDSPIDAYPAGVRRKEFEYGLYRLSTSGGERPPDAIDLTIGGLDDLNVVRFHARERHHVTGEPFRWTRNQSFVVLNGIPSDARAITLWMSHGGRPASAPSPAVELSIDEEVLGVVVPTDKVLPYSVPLPASLTARAAGQTDPVRLRLRTSTWNPAELLGAPDDRDLGVMVTRIVVQ